MLPDRIKGFLPETDPVLHLPVSLKFLDEAAYNLPSMVSKKEIRSFLDNLEIVDFSKCILTKAEVERFMLVYSYFASAYIFVPDMPEIKILPSSVAIPLTQVAEQLGRKPILSYASYCLNNWQRIDSKKPVELGNISLIQNFCSGDSKQDEDWFILIHVDIESKAALALESVVDALFLLSSAEREANFPATNLTGVLRNIRRSFLAMNASMDRMPEQCRPEMYFKYVRPYIFSFENVVYSGVKQFEGKPQTFRGETGAQSSIIPTMNAILGVRHKESLLTKHLNVMRDYMPKNHRKFIEHVESYNDKQSNVRNIVIKSGNQDLINDYNNCIEELIKFRNTHFKYAVEYIANRVSNPKGTGGTPYIEWLAKLVSETEEYLIKL